MVRYVAFLLLFCVVSRPEAQTLIDSVVAVVSGDAVTRSELDGALGIAAIMQTAVTETSTITERRIALDTIINRKLVLQESKRLGIVLTDRDARLREKIAEFRRKYASPEAFQHALQAHGLEEEILKTWVYEELVYAEFFRRIFFNALNSAEIATLARSYYDAHSTEFIAPPTVTFNALFILIPGDVSEVEKQTAEDRVHRLYMGLQQGAAFDAVSEVYKTQLAIRFEVLTLDVDTPLGAIVAGLQDSELSELLPVSDGYQIVERIRRKPARQKTYEEVSEEIIDRIQQKQAEAEFAAWLTEQKKKKSWYILDDALEQESGIK